MTSFRVQQTLHRPASEGKCLNQAFAQACAVCSPETGVNECNRELRQLTK
jgi:hypothetical protein